MTDETAARPDAEPPAPDSAPAPVEVTMPPQPGELALAGYETLGEAEMMEIARTRVRELEGEHFRTRLLMAEANDAQSMQALTTQLHELTRRIRVHTTPDPAPVPEQQQEAVPDPPVPSASPAPPDASVNGHRAPGAAAADKGSASR